MRRLRSIPIRYRWLLVAAVAIALVIGVRLALEAANGPTSPPPSRLPGEAHNLGGAVRSQGHCESALSRDLDHTVRSRDSSRGNALARTIAGVCGALPAQARLQVAANEVLTIMGSRRG